VPDGTPGDNLPTLHPLLRRHWRRRSLEPRGRTRNRTALDPDGLHRDARRAETRQSGNPPGSTSRAHWRLSADSKNGRPSRWGRVGFSSQVGAPP